MTYVDFEFEAVSSSRSYPDVSGVEQGSKERIFGKKPVNDTFPFSSREEIDELVGWVYISQKNIERLLFAILTIMKIDLAMSTTSKPKTLNSLRDDLQP